MPRALGLADAHVRLALLLTLPVCLALGLSVGPMMRVPAGWLGWLSTLLVQPLLEELAFRGLVQSFLLGLFSPAGQPRRCGPVTLANALTTLLFVLLHLRVQPLLWALAVAGPSLLLGHVRERLDSVWPAVLLHGWFNLGFSLAGCLAQQKS
jgi:membrane protease YdiL (CAAX protease family)